MTEQPAAPRDAGRSRAGNAMARTRAAVLAGARQCVQKQGTRKTTMVDVAATAGVAKATLYNHFRTKSEVLAALVESEVAAAASETAEVASTAGLEVALARLAERLGEHPVVRRLAATEATVLVGLVLPADPPQSGWAVAREELGTLLVPAIAPDVLPAAVETVLRWLVSQLLWPGSREESRWAVRRLLAADAGTSAAVAPAVAAAAAVAAVAWETGESGKTGNAGNAGNAGIAGKAPAPSAAAHSDAAVGVGVGALADAAAAVPGLGFPGVELRAGRDLRAVARPLR